MILVFPGPSNTPEAKRAFALRYVNWLVVRLLTYCTLCDVCQFPTSVVTQIPKHIYKDLLGMSTAMPAGCAHSEYTRLARTEIYCHNPIVVAVANENAVLAYCQWQQTTWIIKLAVRAMLPAVAAKQPDLVRWVCCTNRYHAARQPNRMPWLFNADLVQGHSVHAISSQRTQDSNHCLVDTTTDDLLCWRYGQARWPLRYIPHRVAGR